MRWEMLLDGPGRLGDRLREAIRRGQLRPGTRLPSSRDLAAQLGVARGTVVSAYDHLIAEGYLSARHGSGTFVAAGLPETTAAEPGERLSMGPGLPSLAAFPRAAWLASTKAVLRELPDSGLGYGDSAGIPELRAELSAYLGRVRAVVSTSDDIVVTHGTFEALGLLAQALVGAGHKTVAVEDPSHRAQLDLLRRNGLEPVPVPVDDDGLDVAALSRTECRVVLTTAAHQYPMGVVLSPPRRRDLVRWAQTVDGIVLEDDYDAEFRFDRAAMPALQSLDPERVAYIGTLSKTLAPAIRLGWVVLPPALRESVTEGKFLHDRGTGALQQATFAHLLRTGGYDRHLQRCRRLYEQRRRALLDALHTHMPGWKPEGIAAGLHVVLRTPPDVDDRELTETLARHGIGVAPLSLYAHSHPARSGLVIGFAALTADRLTAAIGEISGLADRG